jgi:diguanylate cyclase (GGDEF)-like protein/PAS domain S-box-containing protein
LNRAHKENRKAFEKMAGPKGKKKKEANPLTRLTGPSRSEPVELSRLMNFGRSIFSSLRLHETLQNIAKYAPLSLGMDAAILHLYNPRRKKLEAGAKYQMGIGSGAKLTRGENLAKIVFKTGKAFPVPRIAEDSRFFPQEETPAGKFISALCFPLRGRKKPLGMLTLFSRKAWKGDRRKLLSWQPLMDLAGLALEMAEAYEQEERKRKDTLRQIKKERKIRKFLENIVDRSIDPIMVTDLHGRLTFISRGTEEMFGRSKDEILGQKISDFYSGGVREAKKIMKTMARRGKLPNYETDFIGKNGKMVSVILSATLLRDNKGNPIGTLGVSREVTEYKNLLNQITQTERSYQKLFEAVNDAIFSLNREGFFSTFNPMFLKMTGYTENEMRNCHFSKIIHPEDLPVMMSDYQKVIRGEPAPERYTFRVINKEEKVIFVEGNFRRLKEKNQVVAILGVLRDVTEKIKLEKELRELSITDSLTGLHNRRHFFNELDKEMERVKRQGTRLSLLLFDLDDFKVYNDVHGHLEGDIVLNHVGDAVKKSIRRVDSAYRYGGDEFTVILPGAGKEEAAQVAERIRYAFRKNPHLQQTSLSIGLVQFSPQFDLTTFIQRADEAMYTAKKLGGNQIYIRPAE